MNVYIRDEQPHDAEHIESLTQAAFSEVTYSNQCEHFVIRALRQANALTISLVAEYEGAVIGYVAISPVVLSDNQNGWFGLGPVAVSPAQQGQGIGSLLINKALEVLKHTHAKGCVVLGDPAYYSRFGFVTNEKLVLADVPPEYFQVCAFTEYVPTAVVTYHNAFSATS
ncbi:GNAT family N-acetyltransferase [Pseudoalteromonas obscura]|uniref:N-acetyltransferase n=1 Tax=Pseudoalteromonas obscura TaxID=3048491 RepID=A0ABT7EK59_9GAMM|nr:N-acetyltransferase [Pseudoalteromonas sp. P94(2023)]MDK2595437.1 N-acetyltransferase [Pseudoalteromonas sp. P94(2023)]